MFIVTAGNSFSKPGKITSVISDLFQFRVHFEFILSDAFYGIKENPNMLIAMNYF